MSPIKQLSEQLQTEGWKIQQLQKCGLSLYEAIDAYDQGVDSHDLEFFLKQHPDCSPSMAYRIV